MLLAGILMMIQGFGAALTSWLGDGSWGLLAVAEKQVTLPSWTGVAVGGLGLALTAVALLARRAGRGAAAPTGRSR